MIGDVEAKITYNVERQSVSYSTLPADWVVETHGFTNREDAQRYLNDYLLLDNFLNHKYRIRRVLTISEVIHE